MTREMGKVLKEAGGDVQEAVDYVLHSGRRPPPTWIYHTGPKDPEVRNVRSASLKLACAG